MTLTGASMSRCGSWKSDSSASIGGSNGAIGLRLGSMTGASWAMAALTRGGAAAGTGSTAAGRGRRARSTGGSSPTVDFLQDELAAARPRGLFRGIGIHARPLGRAAQPGQLQPALTHQPAGSQGRRTGGVAQMRRPTQSEPAMTRPAAQIPSAQRSPKAVKPSSRASTKLPPAKARAPISGSSHRHCRSPTAPPRPTRSGQVAVGSSGSVARKAVRLSSASGRLSTGTQAQLSGRPKVSRTPQLRLTSTGSHAAKPNSW